MAEPVSQTNGDGLIPGITFPSKKNSEPQHDQADNSQPLSFEGPLINNRPTTVTLFSTTQLAASPLVPSLIQLIIQAFRNQKESNGFKNIPRDRLQYDNQLFDELGSTPGTFTYVISYTGTETAIATASAKRYIGTSAILEPAPNDQANTFKRFGLVDDDTEAWELSTLAVDPQLRRQGLAGHLMRMREAEVKRRFVVGMEKGGKAKLRMLLTTIKEVSGAFHLGRGFKVDYEVRYPEGHMGAPSGFTVVHMSKDVPLDC
ncbi:uncharacterized protein LTR77_008611 [Saxophila tyrrhenica]|uniref:N-acetyltransferase domain-containing protein n=1 Tax=Saxophila tyrrhenica TaxID=1690608 RepID=A0AAV9P3U7_9PEZI|nr:hypothetical protein LTR77_008611 [Saxophila tyrrhenica]